MSLHRLRPADWLTGIAGLSVLLLLFAPWYGVADGTLTGWQAFGVADLWLALTALVAIAVLVVTALRDAPALPVALDVVCTTVAALGVLVVLFRLLDVPHDDVVTGREWGLYAAAVAVPVLLAGAWWAMRDESAPGLRPPPPVRTLPAPPAVVTGTEPTSEAT